MDTSITLAIISIFLPFCYSLFLIAKRLQLSLVNKWTLNHGFSVISLIGMVLFIVQKIINTPYEFDFDFFIMEKINLRAAFLIDESNIDYLIYSMLGFLLVSIFCSFYFNKKKQYIFTKQRFYTFLSLLSFNTILFFISATIVQSFVFWVLNGLIVYIFSYFDIYKSTTNYNLNRFYRVYLIGDFAFLGAILVFCRYASLSNGYIDPVELGYGELDSLISYSYGLNNYAEFALGAVCLYLASFSRLFILPFNCFYSFSINSSRPLYVTLITVANCPLGAFLFLKTLPYIELMEDNIIYLQIFIILTIVITSILILFEKNLKIIFGQIFSIINGLFILGVFFFDPLIILYIYFLATIVTTLFVWKLFLADITSLKKRPVDIKKGFLIERIHIFLFEDLPGGVSRVFNVFVKKVNFSFIPLIFRFFDIISCFIIRKFTKNSRMMTIRNILIIFALVILFAIFITLFGNYQEM